MKSWTTTRRWIALFGCAWVASTGCSSTSDSADRLVFDPTRLDAVEVTVTAADGSECVVCMWRADDSLERAAGLRGVSDERDLLGAAGMIFVYQDPVRTKFWMGEVGMALELHQFDGDGAHIGAIPMPPCPSGTDPMRCPRHGVDDEFLFAIEVRDGTGVESGLGSGSSIRLGPECDPVAAR